MKRISESNAILKLDAIRNAFTEHIRTQYEHRAKSCATCETPGACCLDAHFVNVHITRLEARAIRNRLDELPDEIQSRVAERIESAIEKYGLDEAGDTFAKTYACPLFEKGIGCLAHDSAKPLPCIAHACYEQKQDLPPDELLAAQKIRVDKLNRRTYGDSRLLPLPVAVRPKS